MKIENFANTSQCVRNLSEFRKALANLARLRIWQGGCEVGKAVCKFGKVVAKLARLRISLASEISLS